MAVKSGGVSDDAEFVGMDDLLSAFETALETSAQPVPPAGPPSQPSSADLASLADVQPAIETAPSSSSLQTDSRMLVDMARVEAALAALQEKPVLGLEQFTRAEVQRLLTHLPRPTLVFEYSYDFDSEPDYDLGLFIRAICHKTHKAVSSRANVVRVNARMNPMASGGVSYGELHVWYTVPGLKGLAALQDRFWYAPSMGAHEIAARINLYQGWSARRVEDFVAPEIDAAAVRAVAALDPVIPPPPPKPVVRAAPEAFDRDKIRKAAKGATTQRHHRLVDFSQRDLQLLMGALIRPVLTVEMNADGDNPAIGRAIVEASEVVAQTIADTLHQFGLTLVINQPENDLGSDLKTGEMRVRLYGPGTRAIAEQRFMVDPLDMHGFAAARAATFRGWLQRTGGR